MKQQNFQSRLIEEQDSLAERIEKLDAFIRNNPVFGTLEYTQRGLLEIQLHAMRTYYEVLVKRIALLNVE